MKDTISASQVGDLALHLLAKAVVEIPAQYLDLMEAACLRESNPLARVHLQAMLDAARVATEENRPVCQDTGITLYQMKIGGKIQIAGDWVHALHLATAKATEIVPLRPNIVHPLNRKNQGTNCGWGLPYIHYDPVADADYVEITAIPYGGGGAGQTAFVEIPRIGPKVKPLIKGILKAIINAKAACPPMVVGVCIGGSKDLAVRVATQAVFRRPTGAANPDPETRAMEAELFDLANRLNIGPLSLGGDTSVLALHLELRGCHTAAIPCAVAVNCWPMRIASARIYPDGRVVEIAYPAHSKISGEGPCPGK